MSIGVTPRSGAISIRTIGVPGPSGSSVQFTQVNAAQALGGNRVVVLTPSGAIYADNRSPSHANKIVGVTVGAASMGSNASIQAAGELDGFSALTPGDPVYLSIDGIITQTLPNSGFLSQIGVAKTSTKVLINIQPSIAR